MWWRNYDCIGDGLVDTPQSLSLVKIKCYKDKMEYFMAGKRGLDVLPIDMCSVLCCE